LALTSERKADARVKNLSRKGLLRTLLLVLLRKDSLLILLLVSSLPAALSASYSLLSPVFSEEARGSLSLLGERPSLSLFPSQPQNATCAEVYAFSAEVHAISSSTEAPAFFVNSTAFEEMFGIPPPREEPATFLGSSISSLLKAREGSVIEVCSGGSCNSYRVLGVLGSSSFPSSIFIVSGTFPREAPANAEKLYLCPSNAESFIEAAAEDIGGSLSSITSILSATILSACFPIIFIGFRRIIFLARRDAETLLEMGAPRGSLKLFLFFLLYALSASMFAYGLILGIFSVHFSLWALRLFGVFIESRPLLPPSQLLDLFLIYAAVSALAAAFAVRRWEIA